MRVSGISLYCCILLEPVLHKANFVWLLENLTELQNDSCPWHVSEVQALSLGDARCSSFAADTACSTRCKCSPTYNVTMYALSRAVEEALEKVILPSIPALLMQVNDGQKYQVEYACSCCGLFGGSGDCCQPVDSCSYFTSSCGNTKPVADAYYVRLFP